VQGVEGDGRSSNCGRTNKDGVDFPKAEFAGYERYLALAKTPYAYGGCSGCRFFIFCKGQCPGTAIDGDWRNRTEHCSVWQLREQRLRQRRKSSREPPALRRGSRDEDIDVTFRKGKDRADARPGKWPVSASGYGHFLTGGSNRGTG